ncbi:S-layer homology domain-containing protein [Oscillibacter valericigenes]|uniref:S-layer homology domain-containing protein n=1 Tax=Oscillibacter valericigenes TaxID=351091 RepID=UPI00195B8AE3|nr:S-layer homology domain-containing protein [Oscillibacter valericigenes]MBM6910453.1 S-layer homology domain-containing protein [Oscillibacter valericigenes]
MRLKRLMAILLCLCMALTLLPTAALAAAVGETIHVGGVALTSTEATPTVYARTVGGAVTTGGASATDYNIMWDGTTLTLNGATITQGHYQGAAISYYNTESGSSGISQLDLVLVGENTVTGPDLNSSSVYDSYGIHVAGFGTSSDGTALTISGAGSLTATGGTVSRSGSYWSAGICNRVGEISVEGGTVNAAGGESESSYGIYSSSRGITISGGTVTAEGATQAVHTTGTVTVDPEEDQQIAVRAGESAASAAAISGSPFTREAEINENTTIGEDSTALVFEAKYFHSIAGKAENPGPDPDPDPDTPDPNIYVGGVGLYGDKASNTTAYALTNESGAVTTTGATADNYTIMWDGETLTLSGATIQGAHGFSYNTASASAAIYRTGGLEIALLGENKVSNPGGVSGINHSFGIYAEGDLTISGGGSLTASSGEGSTGSYGIYTDWGGVTVSGGTVETTAGDAAYYSYGIYAFNGDVTVTDGTVNAAGGAADLSYGINADNVTISGDGKVTATGGAAEHSCGIDASDITISGGEVTAKGGTASAARGAYSRGISAYAAAISGDGRVTATGGEVSGEYAYSCGIYVQEDAAISGGTVNATGGTATGSYAYSCGIDVTHGLTISGGAVTATGGEVSGEYAYSYGICATNDLTISGGEVTAEGATQAVRTTGTVTVDPEGGEQIEVTAGAGKDSAAAIIGSPFTEEKEISGSISSAQYFHSIAEAAEGPGSGEPNPNIYVGSVGLYGDKDTNTTAYALTNESGAVTTTGATADNYNIMWDGETLTLNNADITQGSYKGAAIYYHDGYTAIHLVLMGESTVTGPSGGSTGASRGIYTRGDLTISGSGILNVSGGEASADQARSYGISASDITISGGTVTATGGSATGSYAVSCGIYVTNDLTVSGGTVTATGGTVTATGGPAPGSYAYSCGIDASDITISGGTATATGGTATGSYAESRGIYVINDLTISGGEVTAEGGTAFADGSEGYAVSYGIYVHSLNSLPGSITISGGIVNADGGQASVTAADGGIAGSYGISVYGSIDISDGIVNADGGTVSGNNTYSCGIYVTHGLTISGGEVTAEGTTQAVRIYSGGSVTVAPAEREQITVTVGADESSAAEITDSPFQEETEITDLASAAGVAYFKSAAEPARYSVTLHPNGGTIAGGKDVTSYLCGTGASLPGAGDVTRSGYRFAGWYADESLTDGPYTQISAADAGDMAFYARWVRRSSGGGGSSSSSRPAGPSTGHSDGWTDIREEIGSAEDGDTVTIDMNGETEVPAEIFGEIAGKDITVELDMGGGVTWTVDGRDVPEDVSLSDLDLGVDMDTSGISVDVINTVTGEYGAVQVSLDHDGAFGFALTLTAPLGRENAGYWANLYHYDEGEEALTFETSARIAADGSAALRMTHASQYAIVIDEKSHALPFEDVGTDAWYSDAVAYVYRNGLMSGTSGSTFSPDAAITRAQLVTILWRMAGSPQVNGLMDFDDVSQDAYYAEAVRWAANEGIAGGYGNGLFGSDDPITREQMAAILYRFAQHMGYDVSIGEDTNILSYTDAPDVSGYAVAALQWACGAGIIRGTGDGSTLTPQGGATRAQAAVILTRFCAQSQ